MKTETAQIRMEVDPVEPQLTLVPKSGYAEIWELAAEGIYLYKGAKAERRPRKSATA
jgi:hypothetical protein